MAFLVRAPLAEVAEDDPVGGVVGEVADDEDYENCEDDPERPVVLDETVLAPVLGQVNGPYHLGNVDDYVQKHQFVPHKDPVGEECRDNYGHYRNAAKYGCAELAYVTPGYDQVETEEQHRVEDHLHMCHHAFFNRENVAQEMVEERCVVNEMHSRPQNYEDYAYDYGLSACHGMEYYSLKYEPGRGWQL